MPPRKSAGSAVPANAGNTAYAVDDGTNSGTNSGTNTRTNTGANAGTNAYASNAVAKTATNATVNSRAHPSNANANAKRQQNDCRISLYNKYRTDCKAAMDRGEPCSLATECGIHGVGGPYWPVDVWRVPNEDIAKLGDGNLSAGHEKLTAGRDCMTRVMWNDPARRPELDACGGPPPIILSQSRPRRPPPNAAPTNTGNAVPPPSLNAIASISNVGARLAPAAVRRAAVVKKTVAPARRKTAVPAKKKPASTATKKIATPAKKKNAPAKKR